LDTNSTTTSFAIIARRFSNFAIPAYNKSQAPWVHC
jgi:hypothetical protein